MDWLRRFLAPPRAEQPATAEIARYLNETARDEERYPAVLNPCIFHGSDG